MKKLLVLLGLLILTTSAIFAQKYKNSKFESVTYTETILNMKPVERTIIFKDKVVYVYLSKPSNVTGKDAEKKGYFVLDDNKDNLALFQIEGSEYTLESVPFSQKDQKELMKKISKKFNITKLNSASYTVSWLYNFKER